jgi:hypothetical protein
MCRTWDAGTRSLNVQLETPMIARSALLQLFSSRWDREFDSVFLQRRDAMGQAARK